MLKKILLGIVIFIAIVIGIVMFATSGITETADNFFNTLKQKDYKTAYNTYMSNDFKKNVSFEKFTYFIKTNDFDKVTQTKWGNRQISGNMGILQGSVITPNGAIPIKLKFINANDEWQIYAIIKPKAGISNNNLKLPSKEEQLSLVKNSMKYLTYSLKSKNMSELYNNISNLWKQQVTIKQFNQMFQQMMNQNIDFTPLVNTTPTIESATINDKGILRIIALYNGKYINLDVNVEVSFDYIKENNEWKLIALDIEPKK